MRWSRTTSAAGSPVSDLDRPNDDATPDEVDGDEVEDTTADEADGSEADPEAGEPTEPTEPAAEQTHGARVSAIARAKGETEGREHGATVSEAARANGEAQRARGGN